MSVLLMILRQCRQVAKGEQLVLQQGLAYDTKNRQIEYTESLMKMERFVYVN